MKCTDLQPFFATSPKVMTPGRSLRYHFRASESHL